MDADGYSGVSTGGATVIINIQCSTGFIFSVRTALDSTVKAFKAVVATKCGVPAKRQRLIYNGRFLKARDTLKSYGLEADHTIHLACGVPPPPSSTDTETTKYSASVSPNNATRVARDGDFNEGVTFAGIGGQEPFLNAASMANNAGSSFGPIPFSRLYGQGPTPSRRRVRNSSTTGLGFTSRSSAPNATQLPNPWDALRPEVNPRSRPSAAACHSTITVGFGGYGSQKLQKMPDCNPNPLTLNEILQSPTIEELGESLLSDPQFMNEIFDFSPDSHTLQSNAQMQEMLAIPQFSFMPKQQLLEQSSFAQLGWQQYSQEQGQTGGDPGVPGGSGLERSKDIFSRPGVAGDRGVPNTSNFPPEQLYAAQLSQLQWLGFPNMQENIDALQITGGNIQAAVQMLLQNLLNRF